jgi:hypothetical protein
MARSWGVKRGVFDVGNEASQELDNGNDRNLNLPSPPNARAFPTISAVPPHFDRAALKCIVERIISIIIC